MTTAQHKYYVNELDNLFDCIVSDESLTVDEEMDIIYYIKMLRDKINKVGDHND